MVSSIEQSLISSLPAMLMLKLSILMSREVGREVSTPVVVRRISPSGVMLDPPASLLRFTSLMDLLRLAVLCGTGGEQESWQRGDQCIVDLARPGGRAECQTSAQL
jgi:hypothetical protein